MSTLNSLLAFLVMPVAFGVIVYVLVSASSWTRSGRTGADYDSGPFLVASAAALPNPSHLPPEVGAGSDALVGGGASASW